MQRDQYDWIERVLTSMEGSQPAKPDEALFDKIEYRFNMETKVISINQWRKMAAAASLLVAINVYGYLQIPSYHQASEKMRQDNNFKDHLISNFYLYE